MTEETTKAVTSIMFLGADMTYYLKFRAMVETFEKKAEEGDVAAQEILNRIQGVGRLVDFAYENVKL